MSKWMQMAAVALAAVVGLVPAFAQVSYAQAVPPQQPLVVFPHGEELSDTELLDVDGEVDPATVITGGIIGAVGGFGWDLLEQLGELRRGERKGLDAGRLARSTFGGAASGVLLSPVAPYVHKGVVATGRAVSHAARVAGAAAVTAGHAAHEALHTVHVALHHHVRAPVGNAFRGLWDWLTR